MEFATSKKSFRANLQRVNVAYLKGNNFWFNAKDFGYDPDQNLHVDFVWKGHRFFLIETIGYTNGGASWSAVQIFKYGTLEVKYEDRYHDGKGAWQTGDTEDARCEYSELTRYVLKVLRSYLD